MLRYSGRSARARAALLTFAYLLGCAVVAGLHSMSLQISDAADAADDAQYEATEARRLGEDTQQDVDTLFDEVDDLRQAVAAIGGGARQ